MGEISMIIEKFGAEVGIFLACAFSTPVPEEITLLTAGILVSAKQLELFNAIVAGVLGVFGGDAFFYFWGKRFGSRVFQLRIFRSILKETRVKKVEAIIHGRGAIVCFFGRFLPGLRIVILITIGMLGIKPQVFLGIDVLAAVIDVLFWIFIGIWIGNFTDVIQYTEEIRIFLMVIVLLLFLINIIRQCITRNQVNV